MSPTVQIRAMTIRDHEALLALLQSTPGVTVREADSRAATERYLARNPGLSFVAVLQEEIVGCVLCGHDGRRGYLQHLVVAPAWRRQGIGRRLWGRCLDELFKLGIHKTHIDVLVENEAANQYWTKAGWARRDDINRYSFNRSGNKDA